MELKEAIEILKGIKKYTAEAMECSCLSTSKKEEWAKEVEAIDTVLQSLERKRELLKELTETNRELTTALLHDNVHKDKIKEKMIEFDKSELMGRYNYEQIKIATDILKELLEGSDNLEIANIKYSTAESQRNTMQELLKGE